MKLRGDDGRGWRVRQQLDDAVVEELLAARTPAGADEVARTSAFLEELRGLAQGPPPPPSAALSKMLGGAPAPSAGRW